MQFATQPDHADLETLVAVIAHSQIVVTRPAVSLPAGFDAEDLAVLDWIAAEGRRLGSTLARM